MGRLLSWRLGICRSGTVPGRITNKPQERRNKGEAAMRKKAVHLAPVRCRSRERYDLLMTRDHAEVTCRECLARIRRLKLVNPVTLPDVPTIEVWEQSRYGSRYGIRRCIAGPCPTCGKELGHSGGPEFGEGDGHRCSHCECWRKGGYFIREIMPPKKAKP